MNPQTSRTALASAVLTLTGVLLIAAGFLAAIIVVDGDQTEALPAAVAEATATPATVAPAPSAVARDSGPNLLDEVIEILKSEFVDPPRVDRQLLLEGAIDGLLGSLGDPHTTYIGPEAYAVAKSDFQGAFEGIGATIAKSGDYVVIVRPRPGTPAERAGIGAGDIILEVDGESTEGWSVNEAVLRIRGEIGSSVGLLIRRNDGTEELISVTRDEILVASVHTAPPGGVLKDGDDSEVVDLAYIRIETFTTRTPVELRSAIEQAGDVGGLILDLRGNPGGLLAETVATADLFLEGGTILVQVDRDGSEYVFSARPRTLTELPLIVLQDEFSASGSELLAAALQENGRAIVVGARSFGKGTVSQPFPLSNGGALYVSTARWLTPARNLIEGRGVLPDIEVEPTVADFEERRDVALYRAIDALRAEVPTTL